MADRIRTEADLLPDGVDGRLWRTDPARRRRVEHRHAELEFNLVVRGGGAYVLQDRRYELCPGTLVWLLPWQDHLLLRAEALEMWVGVVRAEVIGADRLAEAEGFACRRLRPSDALELERVLAAVAAQDPDPWLTNPGMAYAVRRAWRLSAAAETADRGELHPAVARALLLLHRPGGPDSLEALAQACGTAPTHLSRLLVRDTGQGLAAWRNQLRLERFDEARARGGNLLSAALDAGFGSYAQFHRVFRAARGLSPAQWARQAL